MLTNISESGGRGGSRPLLDPPKQLRHSGFAAAASPLAMYAQLALAVRLPHVLSTLHPCPMRCIRALLQTAKKASKIFSPTTVRTVFDLEGQRWHAELTQHGIRFYHSERVGRVTGCVE